MFKELVSQNKAARSKAVQPLGL